MQQAFGASGAALMAIAILISTFGCNNGLILAGARIYYAMAKDGLFFRSVGRLHPAYKTPAVSLIVQALWTCCLCLSGSYGQLLDLTMFAVIIFYILTIGGLFVLRRKRPDMARPYRCTGYPWLPAIYVIIAGAWTINTVLTRPKESIAGMLIMLAGVPGFLYWKWSNRKRTAGQPQP